MAVKYVAFVGPKGSGKDACAKILTEQKRVYRQPVSIAGPLKLICSEVFDIPFNLFNDHILKEKELKEPIKVNIKHLRAIKQAMISYVDPDIEFYNPNKATTKLLGTVFKTPRKILQVIGTEFIRDEIHPDWHCMAAFSEANTSRILKTTRNAVLTVTDCRFPNEFVYLASRHPDTAFFYVERPKTEKQLAKATHRSETEILKTKDLILANGGQIIKNTGTLEDLAKSLENVTIPTVEKSTGAKGKEPESRFKWVQRTS